jgi:hypothetical protein
MPDEGTYNEAKTLVERITRSEVIPPGASYCIWYYCTAHKKFLEGSYIYEDLVDAIEEFLHAVHAEDGDYDISWYCAEHVCREIVLPFMRGKVVDPANLKMLDEASLHLSQLAEADRLDRIEPLHGSLGRILDDQLVLSMENAFSSAGQRGANYMRTRGDEKTKNLLQGAARLIEDVARGFYANIGTFTAVAEYRFTSGISPVTTAQKMAAAHRGGQHVQ